MGKLRERRRRREEVRQEIHAERQLRYRVATLQNEAARTYDWKYRKDLDRAQRKLRLELTPVIGVDRAQAIVDAYRCTRDAPTIKVTDPWTLKTVHERVDVSRSDGFWNAVEHRLGATDEYFFDDREDADAAKIDQSPFVEVTKDALRVARMDWGSGLVSVEETRRAQRRDLRGNVLYILFLQQSEIASPQAHYRSVAARALDVLRSTSRGTQLLSKYPVEFPEGFGEPEEALLEWYSVFSVAELRRHHENARKRLRHNGKEDALPKGQRLPTIRRGLPVDYNAIGAVALAKLEELWTAGLDHLSAGMNEPQKEMRERMKRRRTQ